MKKILLLILLIVPLTGAVHCQPHWNNLKVYRVGKLTPHDRVVPKGPWRMSLNGTWAFRYYDNPAQATLTPTGGTASVCRATSSSRVSACRCMSI